MCFFVCFTNRKNIMIIVNAVIVNAIWHTISVDVGIGIRDTTSTAALTCFGSIKWTTVKAVGSSVSICVGIRDTTTTGAGGCFAGIVWATVFAIQHPISIHVGIGIADTTTTCTGACFACITWATIFAVRCPISIRVGSQDSTTTKPWLVLVGIHSTRIMMFRIAYITKTEQTGIPCDTGYLRLECCKDGAECQCQHECHEASKASTVRMFLLCKCSNMIIADKLHGCVLIYKK